MWAMSADQAKPAGFIAKQNQFLAQNFDGLRYIVEIMSSADHHPIPAKPFAGRGAFPDVRDISGADLCTSHYSLLQLCQNNFLIRGHMSIKLRPPDWCARSTIVDLLSQSYLKLPSFGLDDLARILPMLVFMGRTNSSTDALIEILSFCEQALTALDPHKAGIAVLSQLNKSCHSRRRKHTSLAHRLQLIPGGLSLDNRGSNRR